MRIYVLFLGCRSYPDCLDRAMELYHNATVGNIALIHYFEERTAEDEDFREGWRDLQVEFRQTSDALHLLQSRLHEASVEMTGEASGLLHAVIIVPSLSISSLGSSIDRPSSQGKTQRRVCNTDGRRLWMTPS